MTPSASVCKVSELELTCRYPEWKQDDDMYPDWDHADECHEKATSAIIHPKNGKPWSFRCAQHRTDMEHEGQSEDAIFSDTITITIP
jgi:hypothetical protein